MSRSTRANTSGNVPQYPTHIRQLWQMSSIRRISPSRSRASQYRSSFGSNAGARIGIGFSLDIGHTDDAAERETRDREGKRRGEEGDSQEGGKTGRFGGFVAAACARLPRAHTNKIFASSRLPVNSLSAPSLLPSLSSSLERRLEEREHLGEAAGVALLGLGQRLEPLGDVVEALVARGLRHAGVHRLVLVGLAGDGGLEVLLAVADREPG